MPIPPTQAETAAFLQRLAGGPPVETHISLIFRGAETVWKLKKAVHLPFLDFTGLAARRRFLLRELELNRRTAPDLYRDVVAVLDGPDGPALDGEGADGVPRDWVLQMARVPDGDFLDEIAARGALGPDLLDALADAVAAFHAGLPPVPGQDPYTALCDVAQGNATAALAAGLPAAVVREWLRSTLAALAAGRDALLARAAAGFVRRAHGDLHLGNICLFHGRPTLFDALEFDEALATIDIAYDLAFLLMDLDRRAGRAAANRVLNRALARSGDLDMLGLLPAFLALRAMVLAHVQARADPAAASGYLDAALAYLRPPPGMVVAVGGLQGSGKTTLARALAPGLGAAPGALVLRSDEIRKRLHGAAPEERLGPDAYTPAANARTNAALLAALRQAAATGHAVIADATFLDPAQRRAVRRVARAAGRPFLGVWLHAELPVLEARVAARQGDASDATVAVLRAAAAGAAVPEDWLAVDATDRASALAAVEGAVRTGPAMC